MYGCMYLTLALAFAAQIHVGHTHHFLHCTPTVTHVHACMHASPHTLGDGEALSKVAHDVTELSRINHAGAVAEYEQQRRRQQ